MTATLELAAGHVVLVDDVDAHLLGEHTWRVKRDHRRLYAQTHRHRPDGVRTTTTLHRLVLGVEPGRLVDHRNGDGLDNRRENLRLATARQNAGNYRLPATNTSGAKGVTWSRRYGCWMAQIRVRPRTIHLGRFDSVRAAADAYDAAALEHFGEFALTNAMLRAAS